MQYLFRSGAKYIFLIQKNNNSMMCTILLLFVCCYILLIYTLQHLWLL